MPATWLGGRWTWRSRINATLALFIFAGLVTFLGVAVVSNYQAANNAVNSLNRARSLTTRRIDRLNAQIDMLSRQNAHAARQRGLLLADVRALTRQLRALGVEPVATVPALPAPTSTRLVVVKPTPHPTVTKTKTAKPAPTHKPTPRPTNTCHLTAAGLCLIR